jgi:hypothetical protein
MGTLTVKRGDTWIVQFAWTQPDGAPVDLTDATARLQVRDKTNVVRIDADTVSGTLTVGTNGRVDMLIPAAIMETMDPGSYKFDLQITYANGTVQSTETLSLKVIEDMTYDD